MTNINKDNCCSLCFSFDKIWGNNKSQGRGQLYTATHWQTSKCPVCLMSTCMYLSPNSALKEKDVTWHVWHRWEEGHDEVNRGRGGRLAPHSWCVLSCLTPSRCVLSHHVPIRLQACWSELDSLAVLGRIWRRTWWNSKNIVTLPTWRGKNI